MPRAEHPRDGHLAASDSASLKKVVDLFYERVVADARLGPFFAAVDVPKLKSHQVVFMALVFGGKELVLDVSAARSRGGTGRRGEEGGERTRRRGRGAPLFAPTTYVHTTTATPAFTITRHHHTHEQEHPDLNLRRIHYKLIRDRGLTEVRARGGGGGGELCARVGREHAPWGHCWA